ncbi:MAG: hypothetical protein OHK0046_23120 [Anaerolineae bacterium]
MLKRICILILLAALFVIGLSPAAAHANLIRSDPAANATLTEAPGAIHLWFTEPLEPAFSRIELRDANGNTLDTPPAQVAGADNTELILSPGALPDGVYTVAWRVVSSTDGHMTQGSFPVGIGAGVTLTGSMVMPEESLPLESAVIRMGNLLSLALLVGSIVFLGVVWRGEDAATERYLRRVIWLAWGAVGVMSVLVLLLQASIVSGTLGDVLRLTRFGEAWLARLVVWLLLAVLLWRRSSGWMHSAALITVSSALLLTQSVFSHASGTPDPLPAVAADWLHLLAVALWVGGLAQLFVAVVRLRDALPRLAGMVARFSNLVRVAVFMLVVTGVYAAWLHIGSLEALFTTAYGQAMVIKLALFMPLLLLGAVNLLLTSRGLRAGQAVWSGRLRGLVLVEILLATGIMGAVGVMTAISPARGVLAARDVTVVDNAFFEMQVDDGLMAHLTIEPGTVGQNTFMVDLLDEDTGTPIDDASLIRLRFRQEALGESELRPVLTGDGRYTVEGANLSTAGEWQIRMTVQRPGAFDTVMDFAPVVTLPEVVPVAPSQPGIPARAWALVLTGTAGLITCLFLLRTRLLTPQPRLALVLLVLVGSLVVLQGGVRLLLPEIVSEAQETPLFDAESPVRMAVTSASHPWLLTQGGEVRQPTEQGWQVVPLDAAVNDLYVQNNGTVFAATDAGLHQYQVGAWAQVESAPSDTLISSHGYLFALGEGQIVRLEEGKSISKAAPDLRLLAVPQSDAQAAQFEMLGSHDHVLLNGGQVYQTSSLGLSWQPIAGAPADITRIAIDGDGHLLAVSDGALWRWRNQSWNEMAVFPAGTLADLVSFTGTVYAVVSGHVLRLEAADWVPADLPADAYITDLAFQYPDTLWALDAAGARLFSTENGTSWLTTLVN